MTLSSIHPFHCPNGTGTSTTARSRRSPNADAYLIPCVVPVPWVRTAVEAGLPCVGVDIDPLAALMARVWTTPLGYPANLR